MKKILLILISTILIFGGSIKKSKATGFSYFVLLVIEGAKETMNNRPDYEKYCSFDISSIFKAITGSGSKAENTLCTTNIMILYVATQVAYNAAAIAMKTGLEAVGTPSIVAAAAGEVAGYAAAYLAAMTQLGTSYELALKANSNYRVCRDDPDNNKNVNGPIAYTDKQIKAIYNYHKDRNPTKEELKEAQSKLCIELNYGTASDPDSAKGTMKWLGKGECFMGTHCDGSLACPLGTQFCAYALNGDKGVLCARLSSTCPCRIPLNKGLEELPSASIDSIQGGYTTNDDGSLKFSGLDGLDEKGFNDPNFLYHCRLMRSDTAWASDLFVKNDIVDPACKDLKGSSKNKGSFSVTAPAAECIIGTFRNLFEKSILRDPSLISMSDDDILKLNNIDYDIAVLGTLVNKMISFRNNGFSYESVLGKNTVNTELANNVISTSNSSYDIEVRLALRGLKTGSYDSIVTKRVKMRDVYKTKTDAITSDGFLRTSQFDDDADFKVYYAQTLADIKAVNGILTVLQDARNDVRTKSISDVTALTPYGYFQSYFKSLIVTCMVMYVMIIGWKVLNGSYSLKVSEIIKQFFTIMMVVYFAIGDGWKNYGINVLMNTSTGVAKIVIDIMFNEAAENTSKIPDDGCISSPYFFELKTFESDAAKWCKSGETNSACLTLVRDYIVRGTMASGSSASIAMIGNSLTTYCKGKQGSGDVLFYNFPSLGLGKYKYYCPRSDYWPRPNYEFPFVPIDVPSYLMTDFRTNSGKTFYNESYLPLRCTDGDRKLLFCNDAECSKVTASSGLFPLYAKKKKIGINYFLVCNNDYYTGEMYTADGYHYEDLMNLGYLEDLSSSKRAYATALNGIIKTAYYVVKKNGTMYAPISDGESNAFQDRIWRYRNKQNTDINRTTHNFTYAKYPILVTDAGGIRDMSFLSLFDTLDCKIGKHLKASDTNIPEIIITAIKITFSSLVGFLSGVAVLLMTASIVLVCVKVAQNYIIGMMYLLIYIYVSPVTIPCCLFARTEGVYKKWKEGLLSYVIGPPVTFLTIVFITRVVDIIMYSSSSSSYDYSKLFDGDGNVSSNCISGNWNIGKKSFTVDDINNTPYACLLHKMSEGNGAKAAAAMFFMMFIMPAIGPTTALLGGLTMAIGATMVLADTVSNASIYYALFMKSIVVLITMNVMISMTDKFEGAIGSIFGGVEASKYGIGNVSSIANAGNIASKFKGGLQAAGKISRGVLGGATSAIAAKGKQAVNGINEARAGSNKPDSVPQASNLKGENSESHSEIRAQEQKQQEDGLQEKLAARKAKKAEKQESDQDVQSMMNIDVSDN